MATPTFLPGKSHGEEPGRLQSIRLQRVGHDLVTKQQKCVLNTTIATAFNVCSAVNQIQPVGWYFADDVAGPVLGAEGTLLTEFLFCVQSGSLPSARRCLPPATCPSTLGAHRKWSSSPLHPTTNHWASTVARGLALEPALNNPVRCPSTVCARWPRLTLQPDEVASSPHSFSLNCQNYTPTPSASVITASRPAILPSPSQPLCHSTVIILHPMKPQVSLSAFHGGGN